VLAIIWAQMKTINIEKNSEITFHGQEFNKEFASLNENTHENILYEFEYLIDDDLFSLLIDKTNWLDIEALNDIKTLIYKSEDSELYIKNLALRLDQVIDN
jgi:hypothetical protein